MTRPSSTGRVGPAARLKAAWRALCGDAAADAADAPPACVLPPVSADEPPTPPTPADEPTASAAIRAVAHAVRNELAPLSISLSLLRMIRDAGMSPAAVSPAGVSPADASPAAASPSTDGPLRAAEASLRRTVRLLDRLGDAIAESVEGEAADALLVVEQAVRDAREDRSSRPGGTPPASVVDVAVGSAAAVVACGRSWRTVVEELVGNAFRHARSRVRVAVRAGGGRDACGLTLLVEDDGSGLAAGDDLFDAFVRRHGGGAGLGLYRARRAARRLGGDVAVATADDGAAGLGGAAMVCRVPAALRPAAENRPGIDASGEHPGG